MVLNRVRGGGIIATGNRILSSLALGGLYALLTGSALAGIIVASGFYIWALPGWGLYFAAGHGKWPKNQKEIGFIDAIGLKLIPFKKASKHWTNYARGIICMGLRGGIFSLPLFAGLSYLYGIQALLLWPIFFLQGLAYFIAAKLDEEFVMVAELIWGGVIGVILFYLWT